MKAYIISFNRLTPLRKLCKELVKRKCTPVIIDNESTYPPLVKWLYECRKYEVFTTDGGSRSPWTSGIIKDDFYIVTDPDLDISAVPLDMVDVLTEGLESEPSAVKCGLSLTIDDLPENDYTKAVIEHEGQFWITKAGDHYSAPIDTTLALYSRERLEGKKPEQFYNAIRTAPPYSASHLPWYLEPGKISKEEQYYFDHIGNDGFWVRKFKEVWRQ